ncbi:MAG: aldehyde dehydrogenase family protein [Actinobacteria bacterium]|nr:aldehyde dehydrogenase family protein [Actinomycetota bacterium]
MSATGSLPAERTLAMLIGGRRVAAGSGATIESRDPATGELLAAFPRGDQRDVEAAVAAAGEAFPAWKRTPVTERAACLERLADLIGEHAEELAMLDVRDNGSPIREMRNDAHVAVAQLRYFAGLALQVRGETIPTDPERLDYTLREPFGIVGRIIPFNHPLMFAATKIAAPLVAGNTVILKPSEHTSLSALRLADFLAEALPPGVANVVTGYGSEAGEALVGHPAVRRLAFIGSVEIGLAIQRRAAQDTVKTVTLELGGKNALTVFPDADVEAAIDGALRGMNFTWQGQSCGSTSRLLVHRSLHEDFVARLGERVTALRSGPPTAEQTDTGAIVHRGQFEKVLSYLEVGRQEGATVVAGGGPAEVPGLEDGMFVRPTVFDRVRPDGRLAQEEIFGPVLAVMPFDRYDDAIEIANSVSYGLTASVYTRDLATAHRYARDVEAGYVWVNDSSRHFLGAPFGGVKNSGVGREEGIEELLSYAEPKNVNVRFG